MHPGAYGHSHQCGEAARLHLVHDPRTMNLHGARAHPEIVGDQLVLVTSHELCKNFALARGERGYPAIYLGDIGVLLASLIDRLKRGQNSLDQSIARKWFFDEIARPGLERSHGKRYLPMGGHEHDGPGQVTFSY